MLVRKRLSSVLILAGIRCSFSFVPIMMRNSFRRNKGARLSPQHTATKVMDGIYPSIPIQKYFRSTDYKKERSQLIRGHFNYSPSSQPTAPGAHYSTTTSGRPCLTSVLELYLHEPDFARFTKDTTGPYWFYQDKDGVTSNDFDFF